MVARRASFITCAPPRVSGPGPSRSLLCLPGKGRKKKGQYTRLPDWLHPKKHQISQGFFTSITPPPPAALFGPALSVPALSQSRCGSFTDFATYTNLSHCWPRVPDPSSERLVASDKVMRWLCCKGGRFYLAISVDLFIFDRRKHT